ncbi:MAG: 30S ribosomal protein S6 [Candidatus Margulisiibacteriota bacterium]
MASYDAIFVLAPGLAEEKIDALLAKFEKKLKDNDGEIEKIEKWGLKKLNFEFKKHKGVKDGFYILMTFKGGGKAVSALRELLRIQEEVIRQIITLAKEIQVPSAEEAVVFPEISAEPIPKGSLGGISGQPQ